MHSGELGEVIRLNDTILLLSSRRSSAIGSGPAEGVDERAQRRARTKVYIRLLNESLIVFGV